LYYIGQSTRKTVSEMKLFKGFNKDQILKDLDDEEGYYNVLLNDHLDYRYEIL
jgi:hypothetical protein